MGKNLLVINVDIRETRVALIENGIIAELHIERESSRGTLGNIYLGKVSRVLPGMQAAFIDVGLERAAFLHVEDLIRPDDFEAYMSSHRRIGGEDRVSSPGLPVSERAVPEEPDAEDVAIETEAVVEVIADVSVQQDDVVIGTEQAAEPEGVDAQSVEVEEATEHDVSFEEEDEEEELLVAAGAEEDEEEDDDDDDEIEDDDEEPEGEEAEVEAAEETEIVAEDAVVEAGVAGEGEVVVQEAAVDEREGVVQEPAVERSEIEDSKEIFLDMPSYEVTPASLEDQAVHETIATAVDATLVGASAPPTGQDNGHRQPIASEEMVTVPRAWTPRARGRVRRSGRTRDRRADLISEPPMQEQAPRPVRTEADSFREPRERRGRESGGSRSRHRDGRTRDRGRDGGGRNVKTRGAGRGQQSTRSRQQDTSRLSKSTPIRDVVREGQEVMVQVSKEPIGTKGARVTSHISLPGRYVVYLPTVEHIGISKRIGSEKERARLRESMEAMKPPQGGLIVRTLAEGLTKKQLKADVGYLVRLWGEVVKKRDGGIRAPTVLYTELDLVLKTARDLFTDDIEKIVIDDREEYIRLRRFVEMFMPERADAVELYEGVEPIFDAYGIEDEIQRALSRKVPLPSGGHLIIDQAEALTAIDVNTGRFVGKGSKDLEETILTTNLEAVEEIAYQLRFRNIGGLIILDLIDMERQQNREKVRRRLEDLLARDKAKTTLNRISDLGLIEMTRKRTRESLGRTILEPCFYCDGTGQLQSKQTVAYEILRHIRRERMNLPGYSVIVNAHPAVIDLLKNDERIAVQEAERLFQRRIELVPRREYHLEQFDLQGR